MNTTPLLEEIKRAKGKFQVDQYTFSVGELICLYKDGELDINSYSRSFEATHPDNVWLIGQKREFIETLFLGLPVRPLVINVVDSRWSVISGISVVASILEFVGILIEGNYYPGNYPCKKMMATKLLPSLDNKTWEDLGDREKVVFKRAKIPVILLYEQEVGDITWRYSSYDY